MRPTGLCENSDLCDQTCYNLHDGTFECNCHPGFLLDANGYSCSKLNETAGEGTILYEKEASFVAVLDGSSEYQSDQRPHSPLSNDYALDYANDYPKAYVPKPNDRYDSRVYESNDRFDSKVYESNSDDKYDSQVYKPKQSTQLDSKVYDSPLSDRYDSKVYASPLKDRFDTEEYETKLSDVYDAQPDDQKFYDRFGLGSSDSDTDERYYKRTEPAKPGHYEVFPGKFQTAFASDDKVTDSSREVYDFPYETQILAVEEPRALPLGEAPQAQDEVQVSRDLEAGPGRSNTERKLSVRLLNTEDEGPEAFLASQKSLDSFQKSLNSFQDSFEDYSGEDKEKQRSKDSEAKYSSENKEFTGSQDDKISKSSALQSNNENSVFVKDFQRRSQAHEMENSSGEYNVADSENKIEDILPGNSHENTVVENPLVYGDMQSGIRIYAYDENQKVGRPKAGLRSDEDFTSPGPNLEQKVPSVQPLLQATESLVPQCALDCGVGRCGSDTADQSGSSNLRCQCPLGFKGPACRPAPRIDTARFHGQSWVGFSPLREAYRDVQITIEFKPESPNDVYNNDQSQNDPRFQMNGKRKSMLKNLKLDYALETDKVEHSMPSLKTGYTFQNLAGDEDNRINASRWSSETPLRSRPSRSHGGLRGDSGSDPGAPNGVLLVSGENDDLTGDFMAAVIINGYVEFRWDCGSGAGAVRSVERVRVGRWNRLSVYRHRWDVLLQLNDGSHVQGRSEGLFSRITFREPLYVGGSYNLTSLYGRLGVSEGLHGCVRRLQVNDHLYQFYRADRDNNEPSNYGAIDGWDVSECSGDACLDMDCQNGGKCQSSSLDLEQSSGNLQIQTSFTVAETRSSDAFCSCPVGYTGALCETHVSLEVPHFNGTSHLAFKALGTTALSWLELEVVFRSSAMDGLIVYEGHRSDGSGDYIALALSDAHVIFNIDLGSGSTTLRSVKPIRPGVWHTVRVSRTGRRIWMYVDSQPPVEGWTPGGFTMLSLSQPLYLGGVPEESPARFVLANMHNLKGCVQKLSIGGRPLQFSSSGTTGHNVGSCDHPCSMHPCSNGGVCEPMGASYSCRCPVGFTDDHCRSRVVTQASTPSFGGKSFLKFTHPEIMKRVTGDKLHMWFRFRSTAKDGLLIWIGEDYVPEVSESYQDDNLSYLSLEDSFSLEIKDGKLVLRYNLGSGFAVLNYNGSETYDNGEWHTVRLARFERQAQMTVDDGPELITFSPGDLVQLNVESALYIGGRETYHTQEDARSLPGLEGCVSDLTLATDYSVDLITMATAGQNIEYC
ncbi:EGF-like domain [Trinorchestia longiramus]|nr:EGF-like domain [Trinorchestia longiramus]